MPALTRLRDWDVRLGAYLSTNLERGFRWGVNDCVLFALGAAEAMTGVDAAANLRGTYESALGAVRAMRRIFGAPDLAAAAAAFANLWGGEEISPLMARRGDIVLAECLTPEGGQGLALGVVGLDGQTAVFVGPAGTVSRKLRECRRAWRVG